MHEHILSPFPIIRSTYFFVLSNTAPKEVQVYWRTRREEREREKEKDSRARFLSFLVLKGTAFIEYEQKGKGGWTGASLFVLIYPSRRQKQNKAQGHHLRHPFSEQSPFLSHRIVSVLPRDRVLRTCEELLSSRAPVSPSMNLRAITRGTFKRSNIWRELRGEFAQTTCKRRYTL